MFSASCFSIVMMMTMVRELEENTRVSHKCLAESRTLIHIHITL